MIDLVARKSSAGEVYINKARRHLVRHEWGLAMMALERGLDKGGLADRRESERLLEDVRRRLWGDSHGRCGG